MLRRATVRTALRPWSSTAARPQLARPQLLNLARGYAKNKSSRPPNPNHPPHSASQTAGSTRHGPAALKSAPGAAESAARAQRPDGKTSAPGGPKSPAQPASASQGAPSEGYGAETSSELPYTKEQTEFDTSASPAQDATPSGPSASRSEPMSAEAAQREPLDESAGNSQMPLPDLRKGIPSTIDAELEQASRRQQHAEAEAEPEPPSARPAGGRGGGGRERGSKQMPASAYVTSAERRRNRMIMWSFMSILGLALAGPVYLGRNWESEAEEEAHPDAPSGWGFMLFYNRVRARLFTTIEYYSEPAFPKLLPDSDPQFARPYTLVVSLEDLLVHSEWTRESGWRVAKRPGVDYFLRYLNQYYEIVIFTSIPSAVGGPVLMKLDPFGIVMWRLFREATRYKNGEYIKDLSFLNRDLSKIILLDTNSAHASAQPENSIIIPKWNGSPSDTGLVALIPFLEYLAAMSPPDTRKVLQSFDGKDVASEFAAREAAARKIFNEQLEEERKKRPRRSAGSWLGSVLGINSKAGMVMVEEGPDGQRVPVLNPSEGFEQGKMLHDQIRERGQQQYELMEKEIRENAEKWMREIAAEEEKFKRESVKGLTSGVTGWFGKADAEKGGEAEADGKSSPKQ